MLLLELTLGAPAENLALDEALLEDAESRGQPREVLRIWEPSQTMVVVGHSSPAAAELHLEACRHDAVPVLRRPSGGAAIVAAPGCLMYALVLSYDLRPKLRSLDEAHRFVLTTLIAALDPLVPGTARQGTCDLTLGPKKFSGNAVRCKRTHLLYHGTVLYDFPLELLGRYLAQPARQPAYRQDRNHDQFVRNLPVQSEPLRRAIAAAWNATEAYADWPRERMARLVAEKYSRHEWNYRH